jgi:hypothetical protein
MKGYTTNELATRKQIAELISSKQFCEARELSIAFIQANKKRAAKRRQLLKATVRFWITAMNSKEN